MSLWARRLIAAGLLLVLIGLGVYAWRWQDAIDDILSSGRDDLIVVRLYFADGDGQCLLAESRAVLVSKRGVAARSRGEIDMPFEVVATAALTALADGPREPELWPTIPTGARVLDVELRHGVAVVNYSEELSSRHGGGSAGEMLTVGSIAGTLSELSGVDAVQILVAGTAVETLAGHMSLLEPVRVDPDALALERICWDGIQ